MYIKDEYAYASLSHEKRAFDIALSLSDTRHSPAFRRRSKRSVVMWKKVMSYMYEVQGPGAQSRLKLCERWKE